MTEALLEFQGVTKNFGGVIAVNNNSFQVKEGRVVALIGPNGAGKTSTFNCITGMYAPDAGEVWFHGEKINHLKPHKIAELGIARTFQNLQIFTNLSVLENVMVAAKETRKPNIVASMLRLPGIKSDEERAQMLALEMLELVGLTDRAQVLANDLSFGEQRLLEVARALALRPKLLLLDEPLSGLSREEVKGMVALIQKLKKDGLTIFLIEHDLSTVMEISDHIIVLDFGSKIAEGRPDEVRSNERVIEAYLGRDVKKQYEAPEGKRGEREPILTLKDIHTYRSTIHALKGVDLQIDKGSLVAVIGANGAGKSTLLGTIAGQYSPKQGTICFDGKSMEKVPAEIVSRRGINLVPERRGMFAELTVEESIRLGAYPRIGSLLISAEEKRRIEDEMEQMYQLFPRLKERRKQLAGTLSGGEQQMLAIVRGLMAHPKVLLLDEPSLGLAPLIVEEIFDRLYQLKKSDMTIVLVEQNAKAALQIADYAYVLENGRIKLEGLPNDLMQDSRIRDAYLSGH